MKAVLAALLAALSSLFRPRMLVLTVWPPLAALALWLAIAMFFWGSWIAGLTGLLQGTPVEQWIQQGFLAILSHYLIAAILVMLLIPAVYVTALLLTAIFAMPTMVNHVAVERYPHLVRLHGGSVAGSVFNSAWAIATYCIGWILCLPLWLFSPLAIVLPIALLAYLNQRLFRYDALAEHASPDEYDRIVELATGRLYLLGLCLALLQFVPLLNLFTPVYVGLAYTHLCLAELDELRNSPTPANP